MRNPMQAPVAARSMGGRAPLWNSACKGATYKDVFTYFYRK